MHKHCGDDETNEGDPNRPTQINMRRKIFDGCSRHSRRDLRKKRVRGHSPTTTDIRLGAGWWGSPLGFNPSSGRRAQGPGVCVGGGPRTRDSRNLSRWRTFTGGRGRSLPTMQHRRFPNQEGIRPEPYMKSRGLGPTQDRGCAAVCGTTPSGVAVVRMRRGYQKNDISYDLIAKPTVHVVTT